MSAATRKLVMSNETPRLQVRLQTSSYRAFKFWAQSYRLQCVYRLQVTGFKWVYRSLTTFNQMTAAGTSRCASLKKKRENEREKKPPTKLAY
jgi:hypothetical protein